LYIEKPFIQRLSSTVCWLKYVLYLDYTFEIHIKAACN
jgi:hypothetical protein